MSKRLLRGTFSALRWLLCGVGVAALLLTALVAAPLTRPPPLASISETARAVDRSTMPGLERFQARDGTALAYRHYAVGAAAVGRVAVLVHGSSGSSTSVHALAEAPAARGVETYAPDIRGHGASGTRGDIGYIGQLEDDLADLVAVIRQTAPTAPLTLIGHSAGGGFALRVASSPIQNLFARTVLLAPYLGYDAPTNRPDSGGWAPRQLGTFWPIYFMLMYCMAGLWFGYAFIAIGLAVTALTLIGYYFIGAAFPLWMAFVNGGGLILGGLWMRRN